MPGRLVVCPTPIGNIDDVTPAGARGAGRRRLHRLRGHPPHRRAARQARDPAGAAAGLQPRGQRSRAGDRAGAADRARRRRRPRLRRRHAGDLRPRLQADPPLHRTRPRGRPSCPAPRSCRWPWSPPGCRPTAGASRASCRAGPARWSGCCARPRPSSPSSPRAGSASRLAALASLAPDRQAAVCRELSKMHEEVARGSLGELARRFRGDVKGEIVLVIGPAAAGDHDKDVGFAVDALRHLVQSGARPRAAASVVAALTGTRANDLYKALTGREARRSPSALSPGASPTRQAVSRWLLRHHPDLLRQRRAAPRPRLLDDGGRRPRPAHAPARRGRLLPHRHRRARRADRDRRPSARGSRRRSWPTATRPSSKR